MKCKKNVQKVINKDIYIKIRIDEIAELSPVEPLDYIPISTLDSVSLTVLENCRFSDSFGGVE